MSVVDKRVTKAGGNGSRRWRAVVLLLFAVLYGYDLFEAVSDTVGVTAQIAAFNQNAQSVGLNPVAVPWAVLAVSLALPPTTYALAYFLGRGRGTGHAALSFAAGLAAVAALTLTLATFAGVLAG